MMPVLLVLSALLVGGTGFAAEADQRAGELSQAEIQVIREAMTQAVGAPPEALRATPLPGVFEAAYGAQIFYVSGDGRYILEGQLLDMHERRNLTDNRRTERRGEILTQLDERDMIVFGPKDAKHTVSVFTDVDCPYCHRMHREIADYNKRGIAVRYLAFSPPGTRSYDKMVSVWCAKDRQEALTAAKSKKPVKAARCDNPVQRQSEMGAALGVTGTPSVVLANGMLLPGYVPAEQLEGILEGRIRP